MTTIASITGSRSKEAIVAGEYLFTASDFHAIAGMVRADAGIALAEAKATLVYSRLAKRLRALGIPTFEEYCALVKDPGGVEERQRMLAALTTNVTRFFREPHHFEHLKSKVLPGLLNAAKQGAPVRIWSSACSNGQEPYSIAMTVLSVMPDVARYNVKILATDIDPNVVAEGRTGIYSESICNDIPADLRHKWFSPARDDRGGKAFSVNDELRALVTFRELNLIGAWPMRQQFDVIFCRNVVIYFEEDTQVKIWTRFAAQLKPGGHLYIGHSERVSGEIASRFRSDGITTYVLGKGVAR